MITLLLVAAIAAAYALHLRRTERRYTETVAERLERYV